MQFDMNHPMSHQFVRSDEAASGGLRHRVEDDRRPRRTASRCPSRGGRWLSHEVPPRRPLRSEPGRSTAYLWPRFARNGDRHV